MDIQKKPTLAEKQAFWAEQLPNFESAYWLLSHFEFVVFDMNQGNYVIKEGLGPDFEDDATEIWHRVNTGWAMWKKAINFSRKNTQAVPEGFVLVRASDRDREVCELIDQRDNMERLADQLKDKLQDLYKVDFGEYTSCNCPLKNAIEYDDSNLVLVPREPTEEMLGAAWEAPPAGGPSGNRRVFYEKQAVVYKAMVEEAEKEMTEAQEQKG